MKTRCVATMGENPWSEITVPTTVGSLNALRVDAESPWDFFWARSNDNKYLLTLRHRAAAAPKGSLPRLKGMDVSDVPSESGDEFTLILKLRDTSQLDIFLRLCKDIVSSTHGAASEREAVAAALSRTWRWHHLLRGGRDERLSLQEQKGLIGELIVLKRFLLTQLTAANAVSAWSGPLGSPKDFELARLGIEAKARRGAARPFVQISSEHQLDDMGTDTLFLYVVELSQTPVNADSSFTLTHLAAAILETIARHDQGALEPFQALMAASGFRWEDDYSDSAWAEGTSKLFQVASGFPRITAALPAGVSGVRYSISLAECEPFRVPNDELIAALEGVIHAGWS